jgi:hypothetical protein
MPTKSPSRENFFPIILKVKANADLAHSSALTQRIGSAAGVRRGPRVWETPRLGEIPHAGKLPYIRK